MAIVKRVRRLANPRTKRRAIARSTRTTAKRKPVRRLTLKQKLHFGSTRQRAAAKLALHRKRKAKASTATKRNPVVRRRVRRTRRNPALVVTLGALNPRKRTKTMATKRRRKTTHRRKAVANPRPRRRYARRRMNPVHAAPVRRRRVSRRRRNAAPVSRRRITRRRRNPIDVFGRSGSKDLLSMVGGGLVGVAAAKIIPRMLGNSLSGLTGGMGQYGGLVLTGVSAWAAGWAASKFVSPTFGSAVMFGGLMQVGSIAINMFLPSFTVGGVPLALSGMGDLVPGQFVVPQNPLRLPPAPPAAPAARVNMSGINRAFGTAL
jgi:hypothetical protein